MTIKTENKGISTSSIAKIHSLRLSLHRPTAEERFILSELWRNKKVRQFLGGCISENSINEKLMAIQDHWDKFGFGQMTVYKQDSKQVIGLCGLHHSQDGTEISFMFLPKAWGQGLATEAARACLNYGFTILKLEKIIAITQKANLRSCQLLERLGMHYINSVQRYSATQIIYALAREDWSN